MKHLIFGLFFLPAIIWGQCDTVSISKAGWSVAYFDSEEATGEGVNNGHAIHCIDGNLTTFWHTQWQGTQPPFPHEIQINLGAVYPVNGFDIVTRATNSSGRIKDFIFSTSVDGVNWIVQDSGIINYPLGSSSVQQTAANRFGAVNAQYVRLEALTSASNHYYVCFAEINVYQDLGCGASGQNNQQMTLDPISQKLNTDAPFNVIASVSTGLPITYSIVSGPATISGNQLTLNGTGGLVTVKAEQMGDASFYAISKTTSFEVVDLATIYPAVTSKLTAARDVQMPQLYAYKLYANATIAQPTYLSIASMAFEIDGIEYPANFVNGAYEYWWTPSSFGPHLVKVRATSSNGNVTDSILNINVSQTIADQTAVTFNGDVINFNGTGASQWFYGTYTLPQSVGAYDSIQAKFYVTCPSVTGGCDDWDRVAWVQYKAPDGDWHELFRYVTPYGKACNHSIDVTDYMSLLQGNIEIRMYIETWGTGGWKLDLDFEYYAGTPQFLYSSIAEVWHGTYNFGQIGNLQPVPVKQVVFPGSTQSAKLRLNTTGHGWGENNTGNAAEFYNATHNLQVNGANTFTQHLWTDCNPNPDGCTNQAGTWQYDRAGWCPGTIAKPFVYDLTNLIAQNAFDLTYQFQTSYQDMCNPANTSCVSGVTCTDCNAGYNPHYVVSAYVISFSDDILSLSENENETHPELNVSVFPNPTSGKVNVALNAKEQDIFVNVFGVDGIALKTYFFKTTDDLNAYLFDLTSLPGGTYFIKVNTTTNFAVARVVID